MQITLSRRYPTIYIKFPGGRGKYRIFPLISDFYYFLPFLLYYPPFCAFFGASKNLGRETMDIYSINIYSCARYKYGVAIKQPFVSDGTNRSNVHRAIKM